MPCERLICLLLLGITLGLSSSRNAPKVNLDCTGLISEDVVAEIASYDWLVRNVSDLVLNGALKGATYDKLAFFVDEFGSRISGSENLENAIDYLVNYLNQSGLENVHTEDAPVPVWIRGKESLTMLEPRYQKLTLLGLGSSIGTPPEGITAEVIVFKDFSEMPARASDITGKIVVYNQPWVDYGQSVNYRGNGAINAAQYGGIASLARSATGSSIYSPHTGWQNNQLNVTRIPGACITVEDAEMFQRMQDRGDKIVLKLYMEAQNYPEVISRNTVVETVGQTNPEEVVIVSGHIDTWDVGQGAMDDGGGVFISLMVQYVLKELGLRPRRTLRTVLWTGEEELFSGVGSYALDHQAELANFNIVMESDEGTFDPDGLSFSGSLEAACIMQEVLKLSTFLNASNLYMPNDGSDNIVFTPLGVPAASLEVYGDTYFNFHHSNGDTMTVEDPDSLDRCLTFYAVSSYVLADLSVRLPRINITDVV